MSLTEPFHVKAWLHSDKESMDDCILKSVGQDAYDEMSDEVKGDLRHMLYEVIFEIAADPLTGKYKILLAADGDQVLVPQK